MNKRPSRVVANSVASKDSYRAILHRRRSTVGPDDKTNRKTVPHIGECILSGLETLWKHKQMTDVSVVVENKTYLAHKLVLASCSDFFYDKFTRGRDAEATKIEVNDVKATGLQAILECLYTGRLQLSDVTVRDILAAASVLGFLGIHEACEEYLSDHLNVDNCLSLLDLAVTHVLDRLVEMASAMAASNFETVSRKAEFKSMPVEQLICLLTRDDLVTRSEVYVFHCVLEWIEVDRQRRLEFAFDLLKTVRLPLLSPSEIVDRVESVTFLMDIPDCQKLVKDALHYHCMPARQTLLQTSRTVPRVSAHRDCLVVVGGAPRLKSEPVCDEISVLDDVTGSWEFVARLPEPRHHHAVAVLNGFLYLVGGEMGNDHCSPLNTAYRFDPRHGTWLQVASMKYRRESFQIGVLNGKLYSVGGRVDKSESLSSVERYNPSKDEWEEVAPISAPKRSVAVAAMHGKLYAIGGSGTKFVSSRVERFHPSENKWELRSPLSIPRFFAHLQQVGSALYLVGGATVDVDSRVICVDTVERYVPTTDTWTVVSMLRTPRAEFGSAVVADKMFILGGYNWNTRERLYNVESFSPSREVWSDCSMLSRPYTGLAGATLTLYRRNRSDYEPP
ncbi:kelch-like protein 20 [Haliotis rufescens]|uniref:kelch-like protein 20 n=1 Tax=Haliotis rufescens TaxID=6454 RepID=UPI00201F820B|nr:kelch-like protein 20 [Haliotis rufescens]